MSRRTFLLSVAALTLLPRTEVAAKGIEDAVSTLRGVGSDRPEALRILLSPGCVKAIPLVRSLLDHPSGVLLVPFDPRPSMDGVVGSFIRNGRPEDVFALLDVGTTSAEDTDGTGRRQRDRFERHVALALLDATGRPPTSPTTLVPAASGMRVLRGAPRPEDLGAFMGDLNRATDLPPWVANPSLFPL